MRSIQGTFRWTKASQEEQVSPDDSMKRNIPGLIKAIPILVLALGACSQDSGDTDAPAVPADPWMAKGQGVYNANCAACHQPDGAGITGVFPPLASSDFLESDREAVIAAVLFGLSGPITVNGVDYSGVMPSMGYLPDADLAAVLTYVFGSWGNDGAAVSVEEIAAVRASRR
jgi:mono/diheme cytochrome c family protein